MLQVNRKNVLTVAVTDSEDNTTTKNITVYYEPKKTLAAPTVTPSTTEPAQTVTLTANAAATGETVQYSADGGKTYQDVPAAGVTSRQMAPSSLSRLIYTVMNHQPSTMLSPISRPMILHNCRQLSRH
ncbi:hypothetical protein BFL38_00020 [Brachyspira hampsonii]|uniref:Uncharacterized protein n=1 Tax=Brachyspira hampsonii TaxID=1287055 RepID=A0A1E5NFX1_9SPIR|nr:hypothetical protein BFL38_00020 [Brachyspira hampsonii]